MELQLRRCGEWNHDALQVVSKPAWRLHGERAQRIRPRAHKAEDGLRLSLIDTEGGNGVTPKSSPAEKWNGAARNFVATPRYSSLLRLTRRRRHEMRMQTRDRVMLSLSDWVSQQVNDPLVEVDPVTVNKAIVAEKQGVPAVTTSTGPSLFGYLPPGLPKRASKAAIVAAIVLLLAALCTAVILALLKGNRKAGSATPAASEGPEANGSVTNGGARQELEDDRAVTWKEASVDSSSDQAVRKQPVAVVTYSLETQGPPYMPIPQYSTSMDQSDLPLPPSFGGSTEEKQIEPPPPPSSSQEVDDLVVPFVTPPPVEEEAKRAIGEGIGSGNGNGVVKGGPLEEVMSEIKSAAVAVEEEIEAEAGGGRQDEEGVVELGSVEDASSSADEPAGGPPSASESVEEELLDVHPGQEYILIGQSDKLSPLSAFSAPHYEPPVALTQSAPAAAVQVTQSAPAATVEATQSAPAAAVEVPRDSIPADESADHPPPFEKSDALPTSAQGAVSVGSVPSPLEALQAGSDAEVANERRKEYAQVIEKVLPAVSVGAGIAALSSFSGVDGALQVVGALAAANFVKEVFWAGPRQQLFDEIRNIKSHKQLKDFLEEKNIFPEIWSH